MNSEKKPFLTIDVQPQNRFRFRYGSEMKGTHGCLLGTVDAGSRNFPKVKLNGFDGHEAIIRVSLATNDDNPFPHPHSLAAEKGHGQCVDFIDVAVNAASGYIASFQGIAIIHCGKKQVRDVVLNRLVKMKLQAKRLGEFHNGNQLAEEEMAEIENFVRKKISKIDPHSVKLRFEALLYDDAGQLYPLSEPVYSKPIFNEKGAQTGTLKIVKVDRAYSGCRGREEIFIFVEKVSKKNIKVRFFEVDPVTKEEIWQAFAEFSEADVHHQYAISFRTPPYRDSTIEHDVNVFMELFRPSDGTRSKSRPFTYKPCDRPRKRAKVAGDDQPFMNGEQLVNVLKLILDESPQPSSHIEQNMPVPLTFFNSEFDSSRHETLPIPQRNVIQSNGFSPLTPQSMSISPQPSFNDDSYFSSTCDSPTDLPTFQPSPSQSSSSRFTSSPHIVPLVRTFPDEPIAKLPVMLEEYFNDSEQLPDFFDLATPYPENRQKTQSFIQFGESFDFLLEDPVKRGGPPSLSFSNLASDSIDSACDNPKYLAESIGSLSLTDSAYDDNEEAKPKRNLSLLTILEHKKEKLAWIESLFFYIISTCDDDVICKVIKNLKKDDLKQVLGHKNCNGLNPLYLAVRRNKKMAVRLLLKLGASLNVSDDNGDDVLHITAANDSMNNLLQELLKGKDKTEALTRRNNQGFVPLHLAVQESAIKNVESLLKEGACPNAADYCRGRTPLHLAAAIESLNIIKALIKFGVGLDVNLEDYSGQSALDIVSNAEIKEEISRPGVAA
ncbi:transcription factor p65-like [Artemia franciscana]|uniref:transcription factor p65-like n=1 Tax=Artemia franciscana TaxID=6661 RepID=UPI0032DA420B